MRLVIIFALLLPITVFAQFQSGWRTDLYAGINSADVNPALPARSPLNWELNLVETDLFLANNYAYIANEGLLSLLRKRDQELTATRLSDLPTDPPSASEKQLFYDFIDANEYFGQQLVKVTGPSFSVRVGPNTRIGILTQAWAMTSFTNLDRDFGYNRWNEILADLDFTIDPLQFASMAWGSVGLNISQSIPLAAGDLVLGTNVHYLQGERAAYFFSEVPFDMQKFDTYDGLRSSNAAFDGGFTTNLYEEEVSTDFPGSGWSADLGAIYRADLGDDFYRWEIGIAITNLGSIKFEQAEAHRFSISTLEEVDQADYENFDADELPAIFDQFSTDLLGLADASLIGDNFTIALPTSINLNASYAFTQELRVEGSAMIPVNFRQPALRQQSVIALVPRYDHKWFSVALPVSYFGTQQLRVGASTRLGPFFMGTDQLGGIFGKSELTGADFYAGIRLFPFWKSNGTGKGKKRKGGKRGSKEVECYKF